MRSRLALCLLIVAGLTVGVFGQTAMPRALQKARPGQSLGITLQTGEKLRGRLVTLETDRISIAPEPRGTPRRELQLADIRKVQKKLTTQDKCIIAGLLYGGRTLGSYLLEH